MKFLFCGLGSIGQRHLNNLIELGERDIIAFRNTSKPLKNITIKIPAYNSLPEVFKQKPDVAFITNPSIFHISYALKLAETGCHLFIEKPLAINNVGLRRLDKLIKEKKLVVSVGFMMRFHPAVKQIKKWLEENKIGSPIFARLFCGEYLPLWHPWEGYTKSYAGQKKLGGGPINTLTHEIDLANYFFGKPTSVLALASRQSSLKIDTEDTAEILFQYKNRLLVSIHLDYLQNPPKRTWEIVGNLGRIEYDYYYGELIIYQKDKKTTINYKNKFERNDMFIAQLKNFVSCLKSKDTPLVSLNDGMINTQLLVSIHQSIKKNNKVNINYL